MNCGFTINTCLHVLLLPSFCECLDPLSSPLVLQVFYYNLGHMDVLETCLSRFVGIDHLADLIQLPMSACLEAASLGMFICSLYRDMGCTSVGDLAVLKQEHLKSLGMDKQQVQYASERVLNSLCKVEQSCCGEN